MTKRTMKDEEQVARRNLRNSASYLEAKRLESEARTAEVLLRTSKARGEFLSRKDVEHRLMRKITASKTKILAVHRRLAALHPDLSKAVLADIERLHREGLTELSERR